MTTDNLIADSAVLREALEDYSQALLEIDGCAEEAVGVMRKEGFVIDDLDDRWQKLAFTFYTMIAKHQSLVSAALDADDNDAACLGE